jgi:hypothetical protein
MYPLEGAAETFKAKQSASGRFICPVPDCAGSATTKWSLRRHFGLQHPLDLVSIEGEGSYPRCGR